MALENFDAAREYLARHQIHRLFEDCIEDLVVSRPTDKEGITNCIVSRVETVNGKKKEPSMKCFFALGLDELDVDKTLQGALRVVNDATVVRCAPPNGNSATEVSKSLSPITSCGKPNCFITGFPASLAQAMTTEAVLGEVKQAVVFISSTGYDADTLCPKDANSETYKKYLKQVHPIATYYKALGKLTVCHVDSSSGDKCPAAVVTKLLS